MLSERRKYCDARRHAVYMSAALVLAAKVVRCIQYCLVSVVFLCFALGVV